MKLSLKYSLREFFNKELRLCGNLIIAVPWETGKRKLCPQNHGSTFSFFNPTRADKKVSKILGNLIANVSRSEDQKTKLCK